jgi:hypothetical protein
MPPYHDPDFFGVPQTWIMPHTPAGGHAGQHDEHDGTATPQFMTPFVTFVAYPEGQV